MWTWLSYFNQLGIIRFKTETVTVLTLSLKIGLNLLYRADNNTSVFATPFGQDELRNQGNSIQIMTDHKGDR